MKRRPFLGSLAALGAGTLLPHTPAAKENKNNQQVEKTNYQKSISSQVEVLKKLENEQIIFTWYTNAAADILVKATNTSWEMAPVALQELEEIEQGFVWVRNERFVQEQYSATFNGKNSGDNIVFEVINEAGKVKGTFTCQASLDKADLVIKILKIDDSLPVLTFPTPLNNENLILPQNQGRLITKPVGNRYSRFYYPFGSSLNMRFFGGLKQQAGYTAILEEDYENAGVMCLGTTCSSVWQKSLGKWKGTKTIRFCFTTGGYVGVAKAFRKWAEPKGLLKPLTEKIKETPQLKNIIGGRMLSFYNARPKREKSANNDIYKFKGATAETGVEVFSTYNECSKIIKSAMEAGMKKGIVNIRGWIRGGYDYSHPDVWPPEPALGTVEELKQLTTLKDPLTVVLHDNYLDSYKQNPSWPQGVMIDKRGDLMKAGIWAGGQAYVLDYKKSIEFAKKNWEKMKDLKTRGMFIDTTTAQQFYENYDPQSLSTKVDDRINRSELLKFYKNQKQILGSEEASDFGVPFVDWLENRHKRVPGESIPLWSLVFHDCVMNTRYVDPSNVNEGGSDYWLTDMLWGYFILFRVPKTAEWENNIEQFKSSLDVDYWFGQIATAEMTNHEYLTSDFQVERTKFSNGKSIIVNFSDTDRTVNGKTIKAKNYLIES